MTISATLPKHMHPETRTYYDMCQEHKDENKRLKQLNKELLEALENIMEVIEDNELIPESVSYMHRARKAIAKARGEE